MTEKISFEQGIEQLEQIVASLESGRVSLDESFQKYEEGVRLYKQLKDILEQGEAKIIQLTRDGKNEAEEQNNADA